jgi:anti-sigma B factor antagonist
MSVTAITMEGVLRLGFSGVEALDAVNAESVKDEALSRVGDAAEFVVDLSGVEFVDSAGVGVLVALFKTARRNGGRARFCRVSAGVRAVLEIIRLDQIFEIYEDWEDAVRA